MPKKYSPYREARLKQGLTLKEVAERLGVSYTFVSFVEHKRSPIKEERRAEWANVYGVTLEELKGWLEERQAERVEVALARAARTSSTSIEAIVKSRSKESGGRKTWPALHSELERQFGWPRPFILTWKKLLYLWNVKENDISASFEDLQNYHAVFEQSVIALIAYDRDKLSAGCHGVKMEVRVDLGKHVHPAEILFKLAKEKEQDS
jgi:transcriptional regulator with XRE-family HTH domain